MDVRETAISLRDNSMLRAVFDDGLLLCIIIGMQLDLYEAHVMYFS
jgi:hypothetical protein